MEVVNGVNGGEKRKLKSGRLYWEWESTHKMKVARYIHNTAMRDNYVVYCYYY